ncbi:hypothetical protein ACFQH8_07015 [Halomicroarcula sp. GCM10025710]
MGSNARSALVVGVEAVVALTVLALVAGSVLGQPILLGYVETGSMSPTQSRVTASWPCLRTWQVRSTGATSSSSRPKNSTGWADDASRRR